MRRRRYLIIVSGITASLAGCQTQEDISDLTVDSVAIQQDAVQWDDYELQLSFKDSYSNEINYRRIRVRCEFAGPNGRRVVVPGFWDEEGTHKIRFAPQTTGKWTFEIKASTDAPDSYLGSFTMIPSSKTG